MNDIVRAIKKIRPNSEFVIYGDDLKNIQWHVLDGEVPTEEEILNAVKALKTEQTKADKAKAVAKAALLERLGITADEAILLLS
jgi:hypothetical protein